MAQAATASYQQQQQSQMFEKRGTHLQNLQKLNVLLWDKAHKLEFKLIQVLDDKKRDEKRFAKKLVRLAKYLEFKGIQGSELSSMLLNQEKQDKSRIRRIQKRKKTLNVMNMRQKHQHQHQQQAQNGAQKSQDESNSQEEKKQYINAALMNGKSDGEQNSVELNSQEYQDDSDDHSQDLNDEDRLLIKDLMKNKSRKKRNGRSKSQQDDTESDSDFENIKRQPRGERQYLEEYLTLGELGGKIPPSLLVNVSFEKFAKENGFDPLDYDEKPAGHNKSNGKQ